MTFGIISESDREGRAVCLPGGKHNVTPTDKIPSDESHLGDFLTPPPFLGKEGDHQVHAGSLMPMTSF